MAERASDMSSLKTMRVLRTTEKQKQGAHSLGDE